MRIDIDAEDFEKCRIIAKCRARRAEAGVYRPRFGGQDLEATNLKGVCAEWCFALAIRTDERPTCSRAKIADCVVRSNGYPNQPMRVMPQDDPQHRRRPIVLAEREMWQRWNVVGWLWGYEVMVDRFKMPDSRHGYEWHVPHSALHRIEDIPPFNGPVQTRLGL